MSDFELALRNAAKKMFVNAHMTGCEVHQDRVRNDISYFCNTRKQKLFFYIMLEKMSIIYVVACRIFPFVILLS